MKKINFYLRSLFLLGLSVIYLQNAELRAQTAIPSKLDILKYWAPQVFQDTRCDYSLFHQFYQAQDYIIKVNFDNNWYAGDQHENSNLNSGNFPGMEGHCYGWFVETETHYFLKYGYYHSMDDAAIAADRHENDFESVEICIRKTNNSYGLFRCMKTTYHSSDKTYTYESDLTFNDSHPRIYISSNGDVTSSCGIYAHGHGIEAYIPGTHCTGTDAIIYNIADKGTIPTETGDGAFSHSYNYSIIDVDELWNRRSNYDNYPFQSYGNFGGDGNESNGGNVGFDQNCATDFASTFSWLTTEAPYSYSYLHNPYSPGSGAVASLQGNWTGVDIGNPIKAGYSWSYRDVYTIDGGGSDIWETSDQFHYTYQQLSGNGQIVARLYAMQEDLNGWSKAGVMIRETLDGNSKFAMMVGTPDNGVAFQTRSNTGGSCTNSSINGIIAPVWLKIVRTGNVFTAYYSTNGTTWIQNGTSTISMDSAVFIGMAVTSRNTSYLCSATFDNVSLTGTTYKSANDITNLLGTISSQYNDSPSGENNTKLIDNNLNTKFLTFNASSWAQYMSTDKYMVNRYTITSANDAPERDPLSWTFQGSNNGNDWTTLDSRSGEDFPNRLQTRSFSFNNSMSYSYYQINMNNNSGNILQLAEIEIFGVASNDITNLGGTVTAQYNDSPSGEDYSKLIDNNVNTKYLTFHSSGWINYQTQGSYAVSGYTITSANDAPERDPLSWTFQGSNNGVDWTTIDTRSGEDFPNRLQTRLFSFSNTSPYSYFRFNLNNNSGSILQLAEIEIFGVVSNDITNLSGTVTAQYNDSPSVEDYTKLIDNNINTKYLTSHSSGWINYQAQSSYSVNSYTITSANDYPERDPLSWTLQGSNNGVDWTTIDTRSGEDFPNRLQTRLFSFSNTSPYSYFRFNLNNNSGSVLQLAEIEIFGLADSTSGLVKSASCPLSINADNPIQSGKVEVVHKSEITDNIAVYPNPAQEFITLTNVPTNTSIIILNIYGQVLLQTKSFVEQRDVKVDIHDLKVGMYIVKIGNKEGKTLEFLKK